MSSLRRRDCPADGIRIHCLKPQGTRGSEAQSPDWCPGRSFDRRQLESLSMLGLICLSAGYSVMGIANGFARFFGWHEPFVRVEAFLPVVRKVSPYDRLLLGSWL
jgi:hypothetical protein